MHTLKKLLSRNKGVLAFLFCMVVFRSAIADWNDVPTGSMQPTIRIGDRILVDKLAYDLRVPFTDLSLLHVADPKRGDIVLIDSHAADEVLLKRVIGVPGDVVAMRDNALYINGREAHYVPLPSVTGIRDDAQDPARYEIERYGDMQHAVRLSLLRPSDRRDFGPVTVPAGQYLMLGDNRDNSEDSRYLGFFPRSEIIGRTRRVALSLDPGNGYLPRMDRFGKTLH
ncbi:MAG TPA: signal peptidase I [Rhodanobacteraceae bacterium]|nr:signal peptidase I [Rhodanobacteraceae bacterium]